ncbi:MAG: DUF4058 family protein [Moorea sp. SIO4A1]|uniref:DUF4058 family protein n=1 Tax=Moorena sp. SIO4A1 TaxID=2607835 RepID=UPI00144D5151|nr:DUF4058 family protein [Moorena sp. SIO4A1]NEQ63507.1 DUF4058 family protein [Moorena sp. SIO4A1]
MRLAVGHAKGERIPSFQLPLLPGDTEPMVELQTLVDQLYDQLGYDYFIDYSNNPPFPWSEDDVESWVGDRRENL